MSSKQVATASLRIVLPMAFCAVAFMYFVLTIVLIPIHLYHVVGALVALVSFMMWITASMQFTDSFSKAPSQNHLVATGLYRKFRHPVYYFSVTALVGINIFMWTLTLMPLVVALVVVQVVRIRKEDKVLSEAFGRKYRGYKRRTWF